MSPPPPSKPPTWAWLGTGLLAVVLALLWAFPDAVSRVRALFTRTTMAGEDCALEDAPCSVVLADGTTVSLDLGPRPLRAGLPLDWAVEVGGGAPVEGIEIAGLSMNMGLTRVPLAPDGAGRWTAKASLPVCSSAAMDWRADILLGGTPPQVVSVPFSTSGRVLPHQVAKAAAPAAPTHGELRVQTLDGPLSLSDLWGKAAIVYFGYTSCPDICPTTLSTVSAAIGRLPAEEQARVAGLFISVDPDRDSLAHLAEYARFFHPAIQAGTADEAALRAMAADWGVTWRRVDMPDSAMGYAIDHSTDAYLVGPDGGFLGPVAHGTAPDALAARLQEVLAP